MVFLPRRYDRDNEQLRDLERTVPAPLPQRTRDVSIPTGPAPPGLVVFVFWSRLANARGLTTVALPTFVVLPIAYLPPYTVMILRFGGVEREEVEFPAPLKERLDVDLDAVHDVTRRLAGSGYPERRLTSRLIMVITNLPFSLHRPLLDG